MLKIAAVVTCYAALALAASAVQAQTRDIGVHGEMLDRIAAVVNDGQLIASVPAPG